MSNEKDLHKKMIDFLRKYFYVYSEVYSIDRKSRIDLVIIHHSDKEKRYPIGVEIKVNAKKRGKDLAEWIKQSETYSNKEFIGFGKCLIVTCPQVSGYYLREGFKMQNHELPGDFGQANNIGTFLSIFGIGEFQKYKTKLNDIKYRIVYKGQIIWDQKDNILRFHNYDRLAR